MDSTDGEYILKLHEEISKPEVLDLLRKLNSKGKIEFANPFLISISGTLQSFTNEVMLGIYSESDYSTLQKETQKEM